MQTPVDAQGVPDVLLKRMRAWRFPPKIGKILPYLSGNPAVPQHHSSNSMVTIGSRFNGAHAVGGHLKPFPTVCTAVDRGRQETSGVPHAIRAGRCIGCATTHAEAMYWATSADAAEGAHEYSWRMISFISFLA